MWNIKSLTVNNTNSDCHLRTPRKMGLKEKAAKGNKIKGRERSCIDPTPRPHPHLVITIVRMSKLKGQHSPLFRLLIKGWKMEATTKRNS